MVERFLKKRGEERQKTDGTDLFSRVFVRSSGSYSEPPFNIVPFVPVIYILYTIIDLLCSFFTYCSIRDRCYVESFVIGHFIIVGIFLR